MDENVFGELLSLFRKKSNKTQQEVAWETEMLNYPLDVTSISKYESGNRRPEAGIIPYLSLALKLTEEEEKALLLAYLEDFTTSALRNYLKGKENVEQNNQSR